MRGSPCCPSRFYGGLQWQTFMWQAAHLAIPWCHFLCYCHNPIQCGIGALRNNVEVAFWAWSYASWRPTPLSVSLQRKHKIGSMRSSWFARGCGSTGGLKNAFNVCRDIVSATEMTLGRHHKATHRPEGAEGTIFSAIEKCPQGPVFYLTQS